MRNLVHNPDTVYALAKSHRYVFRRSDGVQKISGKKWQRQIRQCLSEIGHQFCCPSAHSVVILVTMYRDSEIQRKMSIGSMQCNICTVALSVLINVSTLHVYKTNVRIFGSEVKLQLKDRRYDNGLPGQEYGICYRVVMNQYGATWKLLLSRKKERNSQKTLLLTVSSVTKSP